MKNSGKESGIGIKERKEKAKEKEKIIFSWIYCVTLQKYNFNGIQ